MKYFILGAFSTAFMLYGIAFIYGLTGTTNLEMVASGLATLAASPDAAFTHGLAVMAVLMIIAGLGFKLAAFPFHMWAPDVYTGSPTPAVGFMATGVKAAALAALVRVGVVAFYEPTIRGGFFGHGWIDLLHFMAFGSVILGNLVAIAQTNVKRMLAYSSIAHAGYILVGVVSANSRDAFFLYNDAALFYILAYSFGTLGAFGALAYLTRKGGQVETYEHLAGIGLKYPAIGLILTISMLSSAGIPPTAGFLGKLYVFRAAVDVGAQTGDLTFIALALVAILTSVAGVYYYLKVIVYLYMKQPTEEVTTLEHSGAKFALVMCAVLTLYLGIFPNRAITAAREAVIDMVGAPAAVQPAVAKGNALLRAQEAANDAPQPILGNE
ncbi:MAG: NADH-quinone oxidoreductase subunit N [bacterium]